MCSDVLKILFVCYGNTCRSAMAKAVFIDIAKNQNVDSKFEVDSAGISTCVHYFCMNHSLNFQNSGDWQAGEGPNDYVNMILDRNDIPIEHKARQLTVADFNKFDYMLGMDLYNIHELDKFATSLKSKTKVKLLGDFNSNSNDKIIMDPYFGDRQEDFEKCFVQIKQSCEMLLKHLISDG